MKQKLRQQRQKRGPIEEAKKPREVRGQQPFDIVTFAVRLNKWKRKKRPRLKMSVIFLLN